MHCNDDLDCHNRICLKTKSVTGLLSFLSNSGLNAAGTESTSFLHIFLIIELHFQKIAHRILLGIALYTLLDIPPEIGPKNLFCCNYKWHVTLIGGVIIRCRSSYAHILIVSPNLLTYMATKRVSMHIVWDGLLIRTHDRLIFGVINCITQSIINKNTSGC